MTPNSANFSEVVPRKVKLPLINKQLYHKSLSAGIKSSILMSSSRRFHFDYI
jgi:hypothetical protein